MPGLADKLDDARAEVARIERAIGAATCAEIGRHTWASIGGANCGCDGGQCSIPVLECERCGDSDYGDNEEARDFRKQCAERRELNR